MFNNNNKPTLLATTLLQKYTIALNRLNQPQQHASRHAQQAAQETQQPHAQHQQPKHAIPTGKLADNPCPNHDVAPTAHACLQAEAEDSHGQRAPRTPSAR
ncbi:uncharacterized protein N7479_007449 [Penicillium vulpinum]|uniref:Uncharacterized protein n=1 Tax=Penicillium vulpinum TaxID=29845 RepID=A0A1V6S9T3_9EURO|nr:uncharacterized protein N7479_007449 [Penicillium vulpinum]KAJ5960299.1 hypothetical protein N7479_007449 [Penicillium vulpinum]OQE10787.1 hypothetical protein PENVUL_c003G06715 [Penicillium vulpinum]